MGVRVRRREALLGDGAFEVIRWAEFRSPFCERYLAEHPDVGNTVRDGVTDGLRQARSARWRLICKAGGSRSVAKAAAGPNQTVNELGSDNLSTGAGLTTAASDGSRSSLVHR